MIAEQELRSIGRTEIETFGRILSTYGVLDLGVITDVKGRYATVQSFRAARESRIAYTNVEILYVGSVGAAITAPVSGSICLLLRPLTPVKDCATGEVLPTGDPYDKACMKCIALSTGLDMSVKLGFDDANNFSIGGDGYTWTFSPAGTTLIVNGSTVLTFTNQGDVSLLNTVHKSNGDTYQVYRDTDGAIAHIVAIVGNTYTSYHSPKSTVTDPTQPGTNWNTIFSISQAGAIQLKTESTVDIKSKGTLTINGHLEVAAAT